MRVSVSLRAGAVALVALRMLVPSPANAQTECAPKGTTVQRGVFHPGEAPTVSIEQAPTHLAVGPSKDFKMPAAASPAAVAEQQQPAATPPATMMYTVDLDPNRVGRVTLIAKDPDSGFSVAVYTCDGRPVRTTAGAASEQELILEGVPGARALLEVTLENPSGRSSDFTLAFSATRRSTDDGSAVSRGYAFRGTLSAADYLQLAQFAGCDSAGRAEDCDPICDENCWRTAVATVTRLLGFAPGRNEPLIAFFGIAGTNRVALLRTAGDAPVPPHYRALGPAQYVWALYLEDAQAPFQTSIDVEFKQRATAGDFEAFDPAGQVSASSPATGGDAPARAVRVGIRRFRVRRPPGVVQVTFSRTGAGYGLRQWQRAFKIYAWKPVMFGVGAFVPATEVVVEHHTLHEPGLADGTIPNFVVITPERRRRQIFAVGSLMWPAVHAKVDEAQGLWDQVRWRTIPDVVFGVGLPTTLNQVYYVGGAWPLAWNRLNVTTGAVVARQSRLLPGFRPGQRIGDKQTRVDAVATQRAVVGFTFGVTIDLVRVY